MEFAGGCGVRWWARHANVLAGCSLMYISECQSIQGATVCLYTIIWLASGSLVCIAVSYCASGNILVCMLVGCARYCASHLFLFLILLLFFFVFGGSDGCGFCLFTGPPSTLDYVLSYFFSFIW